MADNNYTVYFIVGFCILAAIALGYVAYKKFVKGEDVDMVYNEEEMKANASRHN